MAYDIAKFRNKLKQELGKKTDQDEFKPPKNIVDTVKYRFYILPPYSIGENIVENSTSCKATTELENFYLIQSSHWFQDKPHACPRVQNSSECPACQQGFDLLKATPKTNENESIRKNITKTWMPSTYYLVNIYFTNASTNPEELRGKVKYYKAPKTIFDTWVGCLMAEEGSLNEDDEQEPNGVFFDENNALLFQLEINKQGNMNDYKRSKFVSNKKTPIANDKKSITEILERRVNLHSKISEPDIKKLKTIITTIISGDDDSGFEDENVQSTNNRRHETSSIDVQPKSSKSTLSEEAPFEDDVRPQSKTSTKPSTKPSVKPPVEDKKPVVHDDDDDEIERLMAQMDE